MENRFIRAEDVAQELNVSKPYAYKLIRQLNEELKAKGFITIAGRVNTLFSESDRWEGTASELCERLAVDIKPNVLSLRLSINASRLFRDYGIRYQNSRTHDGRKVSLWKETEQTA